MATARLVYVISSVLYMLAMILATIIVPFLVSNDLTETKNFAIALTVIYVYYALTTIFANIFNCYVLLKNSTASQDLTPQQQQCNFLLISMLIGEILAPFFICPISLVYVWLLANGVHWYNEEHYKLMRTMFEILRWMSAFAFSAFTFSILCTAMWFILSLGQMLRRNFFLSIWVKIVSVLLPAVISIVSLFFEHMADSYVWIHIVGSFLSGYLPLFIMFSVLIAISTLSRFPRFRDWKPRRLLLMLALYVTYFVLWLPYFVYFTYSMHTDLSDLDFTEIRMYMFIVTKVLLLKLSLNFFILNIFDERFQARSSQILVKIFPYLPGGTPDDLESVIRYNCDDGQALIS